MRHHGIVFAAMAILAFGCGAPDEQEDSDGKFAPAEPRAETPASPLTEAAPPDAPQGEYVAFPNSGVRLAQPQGFETSETFDGFVHESSSSSVMAVKMPGPFAEIAAGFTEANLAARGLKLISRTEVTHDGQSGILVQFEQAQSGIEFLKWSLLFGSDQQTAVITATFLKERTAEYSAAMKAAVLSARLDDSGSADPLADLDFTVMCSPKLRFAATMSRGAFYTQDGIMRQQSPENPLFLVGPALNKVTVFDYQDYAERRIKQTAETINVLIRSTSPVTIDGLTGFESIADAEDRKSGTPLVVYQVMLFPPDSYVVMQGLVGAEKAEEFLPEFKGMATSFKRKP